MASMKIKKGDLVKVIAGKDSCPSRSPTALLHDLSLSAQIHAILLVDAHTGQRHSK